MPCEARSRTSSSASLMASSGGTSNSAHTTRSTISLRGVDPSAAYQIADAVSFRLNNVESAADMIIISPPSVRAATYLLRAIYTQLIRLTPGPALATGLLRKYSSRQKSSSRSS